MSTEEPNYMAHRASNAVIYTTFAVLFCLGCSMAFIFRKRGHFLSSNGVRKWYTLAMNFIASGASAGLLSAYPSVAAIAGLQGLLVYSLSSSLPFLLFGIFAPIVRKKCPTGFVLGQWVRQRFGIYAQLVFSSCVVLTLFVFMIGELTGLQAAVTSMTGLDGLPALIVQCVIVSIYTSIGGFSTSYLTDIFQAVIFIVLVIITAVAIGVHIDIDHDIVGESKLLKGSVLGWKLVYILPVALFTNNMFMSGLWLRSFASKTDRDLRIGCSIGTVVMFCIISFVGSTGLFAVFSGKLDMNAPDFEEQSNNALYIVLLSLPRWVHGFVLCFAVVLSVSAFDSLQSAMVSTISNDFFGNRVRLIYIRLLVLAFAAPCIVVALKAPNILSIWLMADILSCVIVPTIFFGLSDRFFYYLSGLEVILSFTAGILAVFAFGTVYYGSGQGGRDLILLNDGFYTDDWGPFGAFVAAPVGGLIGALVGLCFRFIVLAIKNKDLWSVFRRDHEPILPDWVYDVGFMGGKPWYRYWNLGPWAETVDKIIFVQTTESSAELDDPLNECTTKNSKEGFSNQREKRIDDEVSSLY